MSLLWLMQEDDLPRPKSPEPYGLPEPETEPEPDLFAREEP